MAYGLLKGLDQELNMRASHFVSIGALIVSSAACAATPPQEASAPVAPASRALVPTAAAEKEPPAQVAVAPDILKACGLSQSDAYFEYNSAGLRTREAGIVSQLAQCFSTGPLKGRGMKLVGHADSRGDEEYNFLLAGRRADSIQKALAKNRLDPAQMTTSSRGELDASGADESGWSKDRRVDVLLAN